MNIVILGSGNIATHMGRAFLAQGHRVTQVYSRTKTNANALALLLKTAAVDCIGEISDTADLYVLAVSDQAIAAVAEQLPQALPGIVVHCSGATGIEVLAAFRQYGVIYPTQSLRKDNETSLQHVPFGIEGSAHDVTENLFHVMQQISRASFLCDSKQRLALHLAAVFANNFSNVLFQIAYDILQSQELSFDLLKPIILETAHKIQTQLPQKVQTGPASRGDTETIQKHLQFLIEKPHWLKIYQQLTAEITRSQAEAKKG